MNKFFAMAAALMALPAAYMPAAQANSHCDYGGSAFVNIIGPNPATGIGFPPGAYQIVPRPTDGVPSIPVVFPTSTSYIPVTQLTTLGIIFSVGGGDPNPLQITCGSPDSANFRAIGDALDMDFDFDVDGDSDTIGGAVTAWDMANENGQRFDLKYAKGMLLSEGSRTRLVLTGVARYLTVSDTPGGIGGAHGDLNALSIGIGAGVQVPVQKDWWLTPRISYTATSASRGIGGDNEVLAATLSSNVRFANMGRGELTMGNLVGYTQTIRTGITRQDSNDYIKQRNWWFRNGLAYQVPLGGRMFGRQTSLRTSYVFTLGTKDTMAFEQVHEAAISFGFRMRETEQRTGSDLLRVGLLYTHAKNEYFRDADYDSLTLTVGYRF